MKNMTVYEIMDALKENKFIALRHRSGYVMGVNSRVLNLTKAKNALNLESNYISYYPIGFQEYISVKAAFINK
jgi:hypothetical protein